MPFWSPTPCSWSLRGCHCSIWSSPWASITGKEQRQSGRYAPSLKVKCCSNLHWTHTLVHTHTHEHVKMHYVIFVFLMSSIKPEKISDQFCQLPEKALVNLQTIPHLSFSKHCEWMQQVKPGWENYSLHSPCWGFVFDRRPESPRDGWKTFAWTNMNKMHKTKL